MLILRNLLMNGVCFAVPGGGTGGSSAPAGDQQQQDQNASNNDAGGDQGNAGDANDNDASGEQDDNVVESEGGETDEATDPPAGDPPASKTDWRDKELDRKHAQIQQAKREKAELEHRLADAEALLSRAGKKPGEADAGDDATERQPAQNGGLSQDDVERAAARQIAARDFNNAANEADQKGRKTYAKDWDKVTATLKTLGGFEPEDMQGILATDDPAKVLHTLGSKPEEYHRIMDLPPAKRLAEMVKMALPAPKPKNKPSQAAAPVAPVGGRTRTGGTELRDDLSDDDWYARRRAQKEANWKAKSGRA